MNNFETKQNKMPANLKDLNLMYGMLKDFDLIIKNIQKNKEKVSVLNFGSGDLKMTKALIGGAKEKIDFSCYDPIYTDNNKLEEYQKTSRISIVDGSNIGNVKLEYLSHQKELDNKTFDLLISNFCFHHFLETNTEEDLKKQIISISPEVLIISEYNMPDEIDIDNFKKIFTNEQELREIVEFNHDWERLMGIHCKYNSVYYENLLESIGYKIIRIEKSTNKFYLTATKIHEA